MRLGDRVCAPSRDGTEDVQVTVVGFFDRPAPRRLEQVGADCFVWVRYADGHVTPWPLARLLPLVD